MGVRQTSLKAYYELKVSGLGKRQLLVYKGFERYGDSTDLEMCHNLCFNDPNKIRPRRNELVKQGFLVEKGKKTCGVSGKQAITWGIQQ